MSTRRLSPGSTALRFVLASTLAAVFAFTACGDDDGAEGASQDEVAAVKVGVLPLAAVAPVYIGEEEGFFADEGLEVEPVITQGGAEVVPTLMSGDFEFGYSNNVSLFVAAAEGLPIEIVAEGNQEASSRDGATDAVVVAADSPIESPDDLEGKTIGVNTLKNIGEVAIKTALQKRGVDVSTLKFVEIPFPDMIPAVETGRLDAGWVVEPFVQASKATEMRAIINPFFETAKRLSIGTYFTTKQYAEENPETVAGFVAALKRSLEYTQENPDVLRESILDFTETPPEAAEGMALPFFSPELNRESLELLSRKTLEFGVIDSEPNLDELVAEGS